MPEPSAEFSFSDRSTAMLLPRVLQQQGYQTLGASAHLWVSPNSVLGGPSRVEC